MIYHFGNSPVFYKVQGSGPALLLIHGFLESSFIWERLLPELTEKFQVITLDLPGHGKSPALNEPLTMEQGAELVHRLLHSLAIERAQIMGHSMGGYISLAMLELFPEITNSIILLNSTTYADSEIRKKNRMKAIQLVGMNKASFTGLTIHSLFSENNQNVFSEEIDHLKRLASEFPSEGIINAIKGMMLRKDRTQVLKNFKGRKIIIAGDQDPVVPLTDSVAITQVTDSELFTLSGSHMSWLENQTEIVKILHFIE